MATPITVVPTDGATPDGFRCGTCLIGFRAGDLQRAHMKGEWHRYNLKRRLADLDPISSAVFADRIMQSQAGTVEEATRAAYQGNCTVCQKTFSSPNSYHHHINSQKHKARVAKASERKKTHKKTQSVDDAKSVVSSTFSLGEPTIKAADSKGDEFDIVINRLKEQKPVESDSASATGSEAMEDIEEEEAKEASEAKKSNEPAFSLQSCLFCNLASASVDDNVAHMEKVHGMFIPEKKYLVDLEGLLTYLQDQVRKYNECIFCGKVRSNVYAAQTHMRDKAHCMIPYMTVDEQVLIGDYYDFRSSYSDDEGEWEDEDGQDVDMDGWETDDDGESVASGDVAEGADEKPKTKPRRKPAPSIYYDDFELHLPSGRSVGHRSGRRYYEQNLRHQTTTEEKIRWIRLAIDAGEIDENTGSSQISNALIASGRGAGTVKSTRPEARHLRGVANISTTAARDIKKAIEREQRRHKVPMHGFKFQKQARLSHWATGGMRLT